MARSSLAYLDKAAEQAVEAQIENPLPHADFKNAKRVRVAGIECYEKDPVSARKMALQDYREDAKALKQMLAQANVSYLAVVPTTAWLAISKNAGLYQFQPDESGAVLASDAIVRDATARAHNSIAWRPLAAFVTGAAVAGVGTFVAAETIFHLSLLWSAGAGALMAGLGGFGFSLPVEALHFSRGASRPTVIARKERSIVKATTPRSRKKLFAALWPQGREILDGIRLKIDLPPAPHETQENLLRAKAAGLRLVVDAVQEAVQLPEDVSTALADSRSKHWNTQKVNFAKHVADANTARQKKQEERRERARAFWASLDPIVTTRSGSATAIIAQYGEFPVEQKIIDKVLNSEQLI